MKRDAAFIILIVCLSLSAGFAITHAANGHVAAVGQDDGKIGFLYSISHPIPFQPALARGSIAGLDRWTTTC